MPEGGLGIEGDSSICQGHLDLLREFVVVVEVVGKSF